MIGAVAPGTEPGPAPERGSDDAPGGPAPSRATAALERVTGRLPAGEVRTQQVEMCLAVAGAIDHDRHLVVQAGTGTGKSLAYLVPAALSGQRVVVATATKALQDQLAHKDLPLVAEALEHRLSFAVLKGRSNYLCRQRAAEMGDRGFQQSLDDDDASAGPGDRAAVGEEPDDATGAEEPGRLVDQVRRILDWAEVSQ